MALRTTRGLDSVPENAVNLSEEEALKYQIGVVKYWKKSQDVFFLRNSVYLEVFATFTTSFISVNHFRSYFNIGRKGIYLAYFPTLVVPAVLTTYFYEKEVTNKVLLLKNSCPLCEFARFGVSQNLLAVVYPSCLGGISSIVLSEGRRPPNVSTVIPSFVTQAKECYRLIFSSFKSGLAKFQILFGIHFFLGYFLPYMQSRELDNILKTIDKISSEEESYESNTLPV